MLLERFSVDRLRTWHGPLTDELRQEVGLVERGRLPSRLLPDATATTVCGFCSTGCGLSVHLRAGTAVNLSPAVYPVNQGMACPKGWEALTPLAADDRATRPLVRDRDGTIRAVSWDVALDTFCDRVRAIQNAHGPAAMAFLGTGQIPTEELALLGALAKFGLGMRHGDANTRQCMATSVTAYKESFGFDAPPYTYADFEASDVIVLVGSNLCIAHPILWQRILGNPHHPAIVVVDPRRTETAMAATQHVALQPKSDLVLLYGVARALIERGAVDEAFVRDLVQGFADFREHVQGFTPERVSAATGLAPSELDRLVATIAAGKRVSFWWTMGVNQGHEATRTAQAIINLALITGNIGRPGTGANSITGQCNAMGSRLFSNTTSLIGGHDFANPAHREKVSRVLGIDPDRIPHDRGLAYDQIIQGIHDGRIRGLWVVGTNPGHSWIDQPDFYRALEKLEFLVVQDMYHSTDTATRADLLLPAAGWGEKEGTFINSERRIGRVRRVAAAPGEALSDFAIFRLIADRWGCGSDFARWTTPAAAFELLRQLSIGQPCDFSGVTGYPMLEREGGVQWPWTQEAESPETERRLFADGCFYTPDGRAKLCFEDPRPVPEPTDQSFPLALLTGRGSSAQWHTETRTGKSAVLRALAPKESYLEIHPADAAERGIASGVSVEVWSRRGCVRVRALLTAAVQPGQVFLSMHDRRTNQLTYPSFDPYSRQPSYKHTAVQVRAAGTE